MANAIDFSLGYDLKPMRSDAAQAQAINQRLMGNISRSAATLHATPWCTSVWLRR
jgi:hypothetical protein